MNTLEELRGLGLTDAEIEYYQTLMNSVENQLTSTIQWLGTDEAREYYQLRQEAFNQFWKDSKIQTELHDIMMESPKSSDELLSKFYDTGKRLGYTDLGATLTYTTADKYALDKLLKYNYELIREVNKSTIESIREVLSTGLLKGESNQTIARMIRDCTDVSPIGKLNLNQRCIMIARTESSRAVNTGLLQAYNDLGVTEVDILVVGDKDTCDDCWDAYDKNPHTINEAMGILPVHPNCRCTFTARTDTMIDVDSENETTPDIVDLTNNE